MSNLVDALNAMEHRLQAFIEGSLARMFPLSANEDTFARRLVQSLPEQLRQDQYGRYTAPHTIVLVTTPEVCGYLRNHPGLVEELSEQIELAAFEAEIFFDEPPHLQVKSNPDLQPEELRFEFAQESSRPGTTAILPTSPGSRQPTYPQNAYLIVEGKNLHPLNQSVINLGRRADNHIVINDRRVSRQHAQIRHTAVSLRSLIYSPAAARS